ncbi:MAG: 16S rRNA (cytosine(1402)-N(4))-methyltransferase RsmH [Candidatus Omnitrophica bacterium]|nr:16S rRNA (cytosine(1402)-N(4))-methyltransferase RsmH [Candidatus Omnitrophota bacterium]
MVQFAWEEIKKSMEEQAAHIPVMHKEITEYMRLPAGGCCVDGTLGMGGHTRLLAEQVGPTGKIIAIDRDRQSLETAKKNLSSVEGRVIFVQDDFRNIDRVLEGLNIQSVDGILLDLGISSFQLDNEQRGFSIKANGPLDMRMDQDSWLSAYDLINSLSEKELSLILKDYGEERWHNRIARRLVQERSIRPIETTKDLSDIVLKSIPSGQKWQKIHPATRTFQAFRIAVNRELESLDIALSKIVPYLKPQGRICIISFHSLEDRIVKNKFRVLAQSGELQLVLKKPLSVSLEEEHVNPRSRSARLRVAEKL